MSTERVHHQSFFRLKVVNLTRNGRASFECRRVPATTNLALDLDDDDDDGTGDGFDGVDSVLKGSVSLEIVWVVEITRIFNV